MAAVFLRLFSLSVMAVLALPTPCVERHTRVRQQSMCQCTTRMCVCATRCPDASRRNHYPHALPACIQALTPRGLVARNRVAKAAQHPADPARAEKLLEGGEGNWLEPFLLLLQHALSD